MATKKEEEDVEVTSPARASYWGRALASYFARHLSLMTAVGLKPGRCCFHGIDRLDRAAMRQPTRNWS
jgi:hypothetical protein